MQLGNGLFRYKLQLLHILKCSQLKLSVTIEIKSPGGLLAVVLDELSELNVLN